MRRDKQIRVDLDFDGWIKKMKQERINSGIDKKPMADSKITKEIVNSGKLRGIERSLLSRKMGRRGALTDPLVWMVVGVVSLVFFAGWFYCIHLLNSYVTNINIPVLNGVNFTEISQSTFGQYENGLLMTKILTAVIFVVLGISMWISNYLIKASKIYFVFYLLVAIIAVIASVYVSNAYETLLTGPIGPTLIGFTMGTYIVLYLPIWTAVFSLVGVMFLLMGIIRDAGAGGTVT